MAESLFEELKRYVGFTARDEEALRAFGPVVAPHLDRVTELFYERILAHEGARKVLEGGESRVGKLRLTLRDWMAQLFEGPWDEAYFEKRARIGRVHVRIGLPQHYMFGAMNVMRGELVRLLAQLPMAPDEMADRAVAVHRMLDMELAIMLHTYREDLMLQQARAERLSTFGQLVGSIGHELRNPLGVIESSLFILREQVPPTPATSRHLDRIGDQVHLANAIITQLLDMIRDRPLQRAPADLEGLLGEVIRDVPRPTGVMVGLELAAPLPPLHGDAVALRQLFMNLAENAVQACGSTGRVVLRAEAAEPGWLTAEVEDSGPGVDPAIRRRLFEPLVTTKPRGNGLGLTLVRRIVERHGGTVALHSRRDGEPGARFVVRLPIVRG